jgi:broad specificity phosphatase PhoE
MGREQARQFPKLYEYHIKPTLVVSSPLRRCLQTTTIAFAPMIRSGEVRALAHPGLQEVSTQPCDTGTPLDVLQEEFPQVQFMDELFPQETWPRERSSRLQKVGTIYDDQPDDLLARAVEFRRWLREEINDEEVIVVTHGGFVHFFYGRWRGEPGRSGSEGWQLGNAQAVPMTLAGPDASDEGFCRAPLGTAPSPDYVEIKRETRQVLNGVSRDCGIFTRDDLR